LLDLEFLDLLRDPRKLGVDSAGETVDVWHDPTSSVYEGKKGRNKNALRLLLVRKQRAAWAPGLVATVFNGRRYICPTAENFLDGGHKVPGHGALEYETRSACKPDLRNDGRFVVNAEDDKAQIGMVLHQVPCYVHFSFTGQRQVYDHQVRLEGYDSLHQGPFVSHHQHGLEQRIEKSVSPTPGR